MLSVRATYQVTIHLPSTSLSPRTPIGHASRKAGHWLSEEPYVAGALVAFPGARAPSSSRTASRRSSAVLKGGHVFLVHPGVQPRQDTPKALVEASGGAVATAGVRQPGATQVNIVPSGARLTAAVVCRALNRAAGVGAKPA